MHARHHRTDIVEEARSLSRWPMRMKAGQWKGGGGDQAG